MGNTARSFVSFERRQAIQTVVANAVLLVAGLWMMFLPRTLLGWMGFGPGRTPAYDKEEA